MKKFFIFLSFSFLYSNSITIYNSNLAYVNEEKEFNVTKGIQELNYKNLPDTLILDSLLPKFDNPNIDLLSQTFINKPFSFEKLLKANLNKDVGFIYNKTLLKGKLLHINPNIIKSMNRIYVVSSKDIIFDYLPKNISSKPYIKWKIDSKINAKVKAVLNYLLKSISWGINYTIELNKDSLNLQGWAKISNNSSKDFKDYNLTLLAGRVYTNSAQRVMMMPTRAYRKMASPEVVKSKEFSGYHIYNIPYKFTILSHEIKQILLIDAKNVKYKSYAKAINSYFRNYGEEKLHFSHIIEFKNSKENSLAIPLPKGLVRVYKDKKYLGEKYIANIAKDEDVKIEIGEFFDIKGVKKITKYIVKKDYEDIETTYSIKNSSSKDVIVKIDEHIPRFGKKINFKTDCSGVCSYKELNAFKREFTIKLKAGSSYEFKTEFEINL